MSVRRFDVNGWFEVDRNPISRVGVFPYLGRQIGAPEPNRIYWVLRPPEELGSPECLASFRLLPFVDEHAMLGAEEEKLTPAEDKGVHGVTGERIDFDGVTLFANLKVFSESLRDDIDAGKKELSAGYRCVYDFTPGIWNGQRYDVVQRQMRGNHLALVLRGRMGPEVAVLDQFAMDAKDAQDMDPELLQKALAAAQALVAVLSEAAGGGAAAPAAGAGDQPPPPGAGEGGEQEKPPAEGEGGNPPPAAKEGDDTKPGGSGADSISGGEGADSISGGAGADQISGEDGMTLDEALAEIARLKAEKTPTGLDEAGVVAVLAKRDRLADRLSAHVGTFDHASMTLDGVAKYGVEKLGLKDVPAGSEAVALDAYLTAKGDVTTPAATHGQDGASERKSSFVDRHLNGAAA